MKFQPSLRSNSALWGAPFALALTFFYYIVSDDPYLSNDYGYAPTIVTNAIAPMYAFSYAVASSLAAWESSRLKAGNVWELGAARSRYRIAANSLVPVLALSWVMLLLPVAMALFQRGVFPTATSVRPVLMALFLSAAHIAIGFAVGVRIPRQISAPLMAVLIFVLVAFSVATRPFWMRHVSGQYIEPLMFGEAVSFESLWPHLLFTGSIALAVVVLWLPLRSMIMRVTFACVLALAGTTSARDLVSSWGPTDPVIFGQAPMECLGDSPAVCMPEATSQDLPSVRRDALSVLQDFHSAGVRETPEVITDRLADGRYYLPSTVKTWRVSLTKAVESENVKYQVMASAVRFSCSRPDPATSRAARLWAARVTGQEKELAKHVSAQGEQFDTDPTQWNEIRDRVDEVLEKPASDQASWFKRQLKEACSDV